MLDFKMSPDHEHAIYALHVGDTGSNINQLFVYHIDSNTTVALTPVLENGQSLAGHLRCSPNNQWVLYSQWEPDRNESELYGVPINGGSPIKLSASLGSGWRLGDFIFAPDNNRVIYSKYNISTGRYKLHSVRLDDGTQTLLDFDLIFNERFSLSTARVTSNSEYLIYEVFQNYATDQVKAKLVSTPLNGSESIILQGYSGGFTRIFLDRWHTDPSCVVYSPRTGFVDIGNILTIPASGGAASQLNAPLLSGESISAWEYDNGGDRIAYSVRGADGLKRLFTVPVAGGAPALISEYLTTRTGTTFGFLKGGERIFYITHDSLESKDCLEISSVHGTDNIKLDDGPRLELHQFNNETNHIFYSRSLLDGSAAELKIVSQATGDSKILNPTYNPNRDYIEWPVRTPSGFITDNGHAILGLRRGEPDYDLEIYSVHVSTGVPLLLKDGIRHDGPLNISVTRDGANLIERRENYRYPSTSFFSALYVHTLTSELMSSPSELRFAEPDGTSIRLDEGQTSRAQSIVLTNSGPNEIQIDDLSISGENANMFELLDPPNLPLSVTTDTQLNIRFFASGWGIGRTAVLQVHSQGTANAVLNIPLGGEAVAVELTEFEVE